MKLHFDNRNMLKRLRKIMLRTVLKQELLTYLLAAPVIVYFISFNFRVGKEHFFIVSMLSLAAAVITLAFGIAVKLFFMRPVLRSIRLLENKRTDEKLFKRAKLNAYKLPLIDSIVILIRWGVITVLLTNIPLLITGKEIFVEFMAIFVIQFLTGVVSMPMYYLICEKECSNFLNLKEIRSIKLDKKAASLSLVPKIRLTIITSFVYPVGILTCLVYLSISNYLNLADCQMGIILIIVVTIILSAINTTLLGTNMKDSFQLIGQTTGIILNGDFSVRIELDQQDELGQVVKAFNVILDYFTDMLIKTRQMTGAINDSVNNISAAAEETSATHEELSANSEVIKGNSTDVSEYIQETYDKSIAVSSLTKNIYTFSQELEGSLKQVSKAVTMGKDSIQAMMHIVETTAQDSNSTSRAMDVLTEKNKLIHEILEVIKDISSQTNLLSLNSAIEAARAGEAGRGFSVVAEEIRKLAEKSSEETKNIEDILNDIYQESENARAATQTTVENVNNVMHEASVILEQFNQISNRVNGVVDMSEKMYDNSKEQEQSISSMIDAMNKSTNLVTTISSQIGETSVEIGEQAKVSQEIAESVGKLNSTANELNNYLERFRV